MAFVWDKVKSAVNDVGDTVTKATQGSGNTHGHVHPSGQCTAHEKHHNHRFASFGPERIGNEVKHYVDGCSYMYAVSMALEHAQHEIWILDWWLSPELYLRRPPARNEKYRLDNMLFAAAKRGVKINIIVYKEVTQALTLSSSHTKHWLEDNDKTGNIRIFRHPDHLPDKQTMSSNFLSSIKESGMNPAKMVSLPGDALKGIYGMTGDSVLFWAHHEKLCVVDGQLAFMGGLDLCFGRWDTNQHSIADAHPGNLDNIVFPGQDYNNARIMDFQAVSQWQNNKLDRKFNSRMGWTDVALSLRGPVVDDLRAHFAQRWNFIYFEKYEVREVQNYHPITFKESRAGVVGHPYSETEGGAEPEGDGHYQGFRDRMHSQLERGRKKLEEGRQMADDMKRGQLRPPVATDTQLYGGRNGGMRCQIIRSAAKWSHGVSTEHSIANAYIQTIRDSQHFVYMENQFFITGTSPKQDPIKNKVGAAIVERIIRAARNHEDWHMIINIPAVPGFAGDLKGDDALGTRAIMEFQYFSINRGGYSIMESVAKEGIDPMKYIRFYNLRNYDRINSGQAMREVEERAGVSYDDARRGHDQRFGQVGDKENYGYGHQRPQDNDDALNRYQQAAEEIHGVQGHKGWDSVASCYMLGGEDIRNVPWSGSPQSELEAFVSEELYIHSKLLIADDKKVICGSANMNDRSQLGNHDSEIAILIEDSEEVESYMAGRPWRASKFAASLRREIFRKHLGLVPPQDPERPNANYTPVGHDPNMYDWGSREDHAVADPLSESFQKLWKTTARTNTEAFREVFHAVPDDTVKNWKQYDDFYGKHFKPEQVVEENKQGKGDKPATYKTGHVLLEKYHGEQGLREVKETLSRVRGTLVEMPLLFLKEEDIAKEGLGLNALTEEVYT